MHIIIPCSITVISLVFIKNKTVAMINKNCMLPSLESGFERKCETQYAHNDEKYKPKQGEIKLISSEGKIK